LSDDFEPVQMACGTVCHFWLGPFNYCRTFTASLKPVPPAVALHMVLAERPTFFLCHTYNYFSVHDTAGDCREAVKTMIQCKEFLTVVELIKQI